MANLSLYKKPAKVVLNNLVYDSLNQDMKSMLTSLPQVSFQDPQRLLIAMNTYANLTAIF